MFGYHDYRFAGVYKFDDASTDNKHILSRIATKVKLTGNPVNDIEIIKDNQSFVKKKVLFSNVAFMKKYQGPETSVNTGGAFVKKNGYGYEERNFLDFDGYCMGYAESKSLKINLERIDKTNTGDKIDDVTVIFTASGKNGRTIVGYYRNATVYRYMQPYLKEEEKYKGYGYFFKCKKEDAVLIPVNDRTFTFPKRKTDNIGQYNIWYADTEKSQDIVESALEFIVSYKLIGDSGEIIDPHVTTVMEEGSKIQRTVNIYERNPKLRELCIRKYGYKCQICGVVLTDVYGEIAKEFIHVHHVKPISEYGENHETDAVNDLITVCPNCHAMLHRTINGIPPTIDELKEAINKKNNKLKGPL
jgi:5-methylcytosine-specific restriction protein A